MKQSDLKVIHVKILDEATTTKEVERIAKLMKKMFEKHPKTKGKYLYLVTTSLSDVSVEYLDKLIEVLKQKKLES